jgi:hypothetical protein
MTAPVIPINGSLIDIQDHIEALFNSIDMTEEGSEERSRLEQEIAAYLDAEVRKVDAIAYYIAHCESQQTFAADEIKRLQDRKKNWEKRQERIEGYVQRAIESSGKSSLDGRYHTLVLRNCPPSVEVTDASLVPQEYIRTVVTESVDKTAAKNALRAGANVAGLRLVINKSVVRK